MADVIFLKMKSVDPEKPQMLHGELSEGAAFLANILLLHEKLTNSGFVEAVYWQYFDMVADYGAKSYDTSW